MFAEAETEALLLLADGYGGSTDHARIRQVNDADALSIDVPAAATWAPAVHQPKWSGSTVSPEAASIHAKLILGGSFTALKTWGETTLGMVTGNNKYFALSPERVRELGLLPGDVLRHRGSSHLRGLEFSTRAHTELGRARGNGRCCSARRRTRPMQRSPTSSEAELRAACKCRPEGRWRVPLVTKADMLLTYMNADTPRLNK